MMTPQLETRGRHAHIHQSNIKEGQTCNQHDRLQIYESGKKLSKMAVCILITGRLEHTDIKWFPNKPYGSA